ncbi:MAG: tetratricopeptide repeat protein [Chitinispirillaceae bacterium]
MKSIWLFAAVAVAMSCSTVFAQGDVTSLVIARPNSYSYGFDKKLVWLGGASEASLYGRFDIMSNVPVISIDRISELLPEVLKHKSRISKMQYTDIASSLGASHLLYSEYEQSGSKEEFKLHIQLVDVSTSETTVRETFTINANRVRDGLDQIAAAILSEDQLLPGASFVGNLKNFKKMGECLTRADELSGSAAVKAAKCLEKAVKEPSPASYGWAARLYMRAGEYGEAHKALKKLDMSMGASSPKIALMQSRCLLMRGSPGQASSVMSSTNFPSSLEASVAYERGLNAEWSNSLSSAEEEYKQAAQLDPKDTRPPKRLAALALLQKDSQTALSYVKNLANSTKNSVGEVLVSIGWSFEQSDRSEAAYMAYKLAVENESDNPEAWLRLGEAQKSMGDELSAAKSFISLYELDAIQYKEYLLEAASIYERRGKPDEARTIYDDYLSDGHSDPEVRIKLASLELRNDNCERVKSLLDRLSPPYSDDPQVNDMISACRKKDIEQRAELTGVTGTTYEEAQRGTALPRILGVGTGIITVGAFAGAVVTELLIKDELDEVNQIEFPSDREAAETQAKPYHDSINQKDMIRKILYAVGGAGAVGFTINLVIAL